MKLFLMLYVLILTLLMPAPRAFALEPPCNYVRAEINTSKAPTVYMRWQSCDKRYWCVRTKPEYFSNLPVGQGWENALEYLTRKAIVAPPLSQDERNLCFAGLVLPTWKVAAYSAYESRPLFDGTKYESCLSNQQIIDKGSCNLKPHWVQIGTVAKGTACETRPVRISGGGVEYHYTTNAGRVRGLSVCRLE